MKLAKSHKIILTVLALALSVMVSLCTLTVFNGKAAQPIGSPNASSYFTDCSAEFVSDGVKITVENGKNTTVKNELAIDNMAIELGAVDNVNSIKLVLTYDSFYVNGNKNEQGTFDKEIVNSFDVLANSTVTVDVEDNLVKVNGVATSGSYYKIRKVDKAVAKISFEVTKTDVDAPATFIIKSIDQDTTNVQSVYKQSLVLVDDKLTPALPVISLDADMFVRTATGEYNMKAYANGDYALSYQVYSVLGNVNKNDLYPTVATSANIKITENADGSARDELHIKSTANATETFNINDKDGVVATYTATIVKEDDANVEPKYVDLTDGINDADDAIALEAFNAELVSQYKKDGEFVPLGTKMEIPSMEDLVYDDRTPYEQLTVKLCYSNREQSTSDKMELPLNFVGDYYFYVLFTDSEDKAMDEDSFVKYDDETGDTTYGIYGSSSTTLALKDRFIFYFSIDEDSEIVITAPTKQGEGYKGTRYTAAKFDITSSNCDIVYKLEYAPTEDSTTWVEIKKFSGLEEDYSDANYDYEELKKINYDGEYTFTPDKLGVYRITVNVTSKMSFMTNTSSTTIVVNKEQTVITPSAWEWVQDNVWLVVCTAVGTLCVIALIAVLCVKPKAKKEDDE